MEDSLQHLALARRALATARFHLHEAAERRPNWKMARWVPRVDTLEANCRTLEEQLLHELWEQGVSDE